MRRSSSQHFSSIVSYTTEMLRQGEAFVREILLGGVLASAGVIVPDQLKPHIVQGQPFRDEHLLPLLACLAAETWVRGCGGATNPVTPQSP
jgi:hypothetical protein